MGVKLPIYDESNRRSAPAIRVATEGLDCVVIGYNDTPFSEYETWLRSYGEASEAYRDLKFSFVDLGTERVDYVGLLNRVVGIAERKTRRVAPWGSVKSFDIPNLAAVYLTQYLRRRGYSARYINLLGAERDKLAGMLALNPRCVAITTTFYLTNKPVREIVEFVRSCNPQVKIVVGGPLVSNYVRSGSSEELGHALADMGADVFVIDSQGENTLAKIVQALQNGQPFGELSNLAFFDGPKLVQTARAPEQNEMDENGIDWMSFAAEDLGRTLQLRTARSCAFACSFCNYPTRAGSLAVTSIDKVEQELDSILALGTVGNVVFIDDTFNVPVRRFKDICRLMIRKRYGFSWFSYFRCSHADDEAVDLMAESGCRGVFLGIESGSPTILKGMNKRADIGAYVRCVEALRARGVLTFASFILGFPGETDETIAETVEFIRLARPDFYRAQLWYNEPGTPIYEHTDRYGITGSGFVWKHNTMDSQTAMDHIERLFLSIQESVWLPQFSFDFWIIPYLIGKGMPLGLFERLMKRAQRLMALSIADVRGDKLDLLRKECQALMVADVVAELQNNGKAAAPAVGTHA